MQICTQILERRAKRRGLVCFADTCNERNHSRSQCAHQLQANGYLSEIVQCVIDYVKSFHYVDDYRFACTYIRYHQAVRACR